MFRSTVTGKIKDEPEYKYINENLCCNFTLICINKYANKKVTSFVRCTVWNELAKYMQETWKTGATIIGSGEASNIPYSGYYTYNLTLTNIEIIL